MFSAGYTLASCPDLTLDSAQQISEYSQSPGAGAFSEVTQLLNLPGDSLGSGQPTVLPWRDAHTPGSLRDSKSSLALSGGLWARYFPSLGLTLTLHLSGMGSAPFPVVD